MPCAIEVEPETHDSWKRIEARFRLWSFRIYYDRSFATESDLTLRFVKALVASTQPIRDRVAVVRWHEQQKQQRKRESPADAR